MKLFKINLKPKKFTLFTFLLMLILLISMVVISGCENKKPGQDKVPEDKQVQQNTEETITAVENFSLQYLTLLQQVPLDIDGDEQAEKIELYTSAQRGTDGKMMWDDGQRWVLLVRDNGKDFPLFDGYVQLGNLQFWAYTSGAKGDFEICTVQPGSANFIVTRYNFVKEKQYFTKKVIYNPDNVNMMYSAAFQN